MSDTPRTSLMQRAAEAIRRDLLEGCEADFFAGLDIIRADKGNVLTTVNEAIARLGLCLVVEVRGGPAPLLGDPTEWDASIVIAESPVLNRAEGGSGKTADIALDAVLATFVEGRGHFRPTEVLPLAGDDLVIEVRGKTTVEFFKTNKQTGEE